jgi:hypothetical protein
MQLCARSKVATFYAIFTTSVFFSLEDDFASSLHLFVYYLPFQLWKMMDHEMENFAPLDPPNGNGCRYLSGYFPVTRYPIPVKRYQIGIAFGLFYFVVVYISSIVQLRCCDKENVSFMLLASVVSGLDGLRRTPSNGRGIL